MTFLFAFDGDTTLGITPYPLPGIKFFSDLNYTHKEPFKK